VNIFRTLRGSIFRDFVRMFFMDGPLAVRNFAMIVATKSGQFTADETGKGKSLRGNRRNLAEEGVVRDFVYRVAGVPNLCNDRMTGTVG